MKRKMFALLLAALALLAALSLCGCQDEALENYSSDTFEVGEDDPITWDDLF